MKFALIIFLHVHAGAVATSIPMESVAACERNAKLLSTKYTAAWTSVANIVSTACIKTGDE